MDHIIDFEENEQIFDDNAKNEEIETEDDMEHFDQRMDSTNKSYHPHTRGSHSEKPNNRQRNQFANPMGSSMQDENEDGQGARRNKFKDEKKGRQNLLADQSITKSKAIKTMSLGRELRK